MNLIYRALLIGAIILKDRWPEVKDFSKKVLTKGKSVASCWRENHRKD